jgi:DNA 3'-phosphatase
MQSKSIPNMPRMTLVSPRPIEQIIARGSTADGVKKENKKEIKKENKQSDKQENKQSDKQENSKEIKKENTQSDKQEIKQSDKKKNKIKIRSLTPTTSYIHASNLRISNQQTDRDGSTRQGEARQGEARQGEARQGEVIKKFIHKIEKPYHDNWIKTGTLLVYKDATFQFKSRIIITELEGCLIQKISDRKLYDKFNANNIELQDSKFIKSLIAECSHGEKSLVVLSNQVSNNKLQIDGIKQKFEAFLDMTRIPVLAIFSLAPDRYMKPHTGMWIFLQAYYKKFCGGRLIDKDGYLVVGQEGGQIIYTKHGAVTKHTDIDRAFAYNIKAYFYTLYEYMNQDAEEEEYKWNNSVLSPELRKLYVANLLLEKRVNILEELFTIHNQSEVYVIMLLGPPRCGKTALAKNILEEWQTSKLSKNYAIEYLSAVKNVANKFIKLLDKRINVILELHNGSEKYRSKYVAHCREKNIPILYIAVDMGKMASVMNHVCVQTSKEENVFLVSERKYAEYRSGYENPEKRELEKIICYYPIINETEEVMVLRY